MSRPRTYIFAGGGTGGHLFPGIAVAQELTRLEPEARVLFVGSERDLEASILTRSGLDHRSLPVESLSALTRRPFQFVRRNWQAWRAAKTLIHEQRPAAVVGLGGYASAPMVWAAARVGIPVVLLEQNVIPGRTTRWLSRLATLICVSFPETTDRLPRRVRVEVTGNPVRREIADLHELARMPLANLKPELLVLGGSQGADSLNDAVVAALLALRNELSNWRVVHQTGTRQADLLRRVYADVGIEATVAPFFDDMAERYRAASLVVSRAGATTLAELACCGIPMVLMPYPFAADDHQSANAHVYEANGAAVVVSHRGTADRTAELLFEQLKQLLNDAPLRETMARSARGLSHPTAAKVIAERILSLTAMRQT